MDNAFMPTGGERARRPMLRRAASIHLSVDAAAAAAAAWLRSAAASVRTVPI